MWGVWQRKLAKTATHFLENSQQETGNKIKMINTIHTQNNSQTEMTIVHLRGGARKSKTYCEKRFVSLMNFRVAMRIEQLSERLIVGTPYKNKFSSWSGKFSG